MGSYLTSVMVLADLFAADQAVSATPARTAGRYGAATAARTAAARAAWPLLLGWNGRAHEPGSRPSTSLTRSGWQKSWPMVGV